MQYEEIRDNDEKVRPNFTGHELRCKHLNPPDVIYCQTSTLDALQVIRNWLEDQKQFGIISKSGIHVLHTFRARWYNRSIGSYDSSEHTDAEKNHQYHFSAIDFETFDDEVSLKLLKEELRKKEGSELYIELRQLGISIGLYDGFIHIDSGQGKGVSSKSRHNDQWGSFGFWDLEKKKTL